MAERFGISNIEKYVLGAIRCGRTAYDVAQYPHIGEYIESGKSTNIIKRFCIKELVSSLYIPVPV